MRKTWFRTLIIAALLAGCGLPAASNGQENPGAPGSGLPTPAIIVTSAPDPDSGIRIFLDAWKASDYTTMYGMLTSASQAKINVEDFTKRYRNTMNAMALKDLAYQVMTVSKTPESAQTSLRITYTSVILGEFQRDIVMGLRLENGNWRVDWEESLILPELRGGNNLSMDYDSPARGNIYDRKGDVLVDETQAVAFGINPSQIILDLESTMLLELSRLTGQSMGDIQAKYSSFYGQDWYIAIGEATLEETNRRYGALSGMGGLVLTDYTARFYHNGGLASQTVGYVSPIQPEQVDTYLRNGYSPETLIGQSGLEKWGEKYLTGKTGGTLYVVGPDGGILSYLGKSDSSPASSIHLTLDKDLQAQAEQAIVGFRGAIVVMERDTGRVLAMVSSPDYDPNLFNPKNTNSQTGLTALFQQSDDPLYNRATEGQYPLGSVFKIITMAAALESGTFTKDNTYDCQYEYTELPGRILYDWTWERTQRGIYTAPSGILTLPEGLMRSCNPWFYHLGFDLYRQGRVTAIADMARGFGLGSPTGIEQVNEQPGNVINPPDQIEAVNQAIGQGQLTVTPLQVARFIAALGNGGTLLRPQLVEKVVAPDGAETQLFKPQAQGTLPIKEETRQIILEAMRAVVSNSRGTAAHRFRNMDTLIYGKTGTAESGIPGSPHAWFAGFTDGLGDAGLPDIAIAVIVENKGEGSDYGAPLFRRIIEIYVTGRPQSLYWWESNFNVTRTPTPFGFEGTQTAQPQP
jgi:penicillin-binding protein 2